MSGYVEMRYDPEQARVIYQPVTIEPREIMPRDHPRGELRDGRMNPLTRLRVSSVAASRLTSRRMRHG